MLLFLIGFLIAWTPSLLLRHLVLKRPVPWWAGILTAFVTFILGLWVGVMLTGREVTGIHGAAAVCAYFTVTLKEKEKEAEK